MSFLAAANEGRLRRGQDPAPRAHDRLRRGPHHRRGRKAVCRRPRDLHDPDPVGRPPDEDPLHAQHDRPPASPTISARASSPPPARTPRSSRPRTRPSQRQEIADTDVLFGRVPNDVFVMPRAAPLLPLDRRRRRRDPHPRARRERRRPRQREGRGGDPSRRARVRAAARSHARPAHRDPQARLHAARADPRGAARALGSRRSASSASAAPAAPWPGARSASACTCSPSTSRTSRRSRASRPSGSPTVCHDLLGDVRRRGHRLPLTKATHHLFTRELFRRMQRHAILINVTRGGIVYGEDLMTALDEGLIWGVGLDVTDPEPLPLDHPLWTHPRGDRHAAHRGRLAASRRARDRDLLREPASA